MAEALLAVGPSLQGPARLKLELNKAAGGTTGPGHEHGRLGGILGWRGQQLNIPTGVHHAEPVAGAKVVTTDPQGIAVAVDIAVANPGEIKR